METFLSHMYGTFKDRDPTLDELGLVLWRKENKKSEWYQLSNTKAIIESIKEDPNDVYFGVCLQDPKLVKATHRKHVNWNRVRGNSDSARTLPGYFMDIDTSDGVHTEKDLPTMEEALEFISSADNPFGKPTMIIHSGGGLHVYWLFKELWTLDSDVERQRAKESLRLFQLTFIQVAKKKGWNLDNTADLARLLRVPGTYNTKGSDPKLVRFLEVNPESRYNPTDFELYFVDAVYHRDFAPDTYQRKEYDGPPPEFDKIYDNCNWMKHCVDDAKTLPEPEWHAALGIVARCDNGRELAHRISKPYPKYSHKETEEKIGHALAGAGPRTCSAIKLIAGAEEHCIACPHNVKSPITLGYTTSLRMSKNKALEVLGELEVLAQQNPNTCIQKALEDNEFLIALQTTKTEDIASFEAHLLRLRGLNVKAKDIDVLQRVLKDYKPPSNSYAEEKLDDNELIEHYLPDVPVKGFLKPPQYAVFPGQTTKEYFDEKSDKPKYQIIANAPIIIRALLITDDKEIIFVLAWERNGWKSVRISRGDAMNSRLLLPLASQGFPVNSNNSADLVGYLEAFEARNYEQLPTIRFSRRLGWQCVDGIKGFQSGKSFIVGGTGEIIYPLPSLSHAQQGTGDKYILFFPEPGAPDLSKSIAPSGDFSAWQKIIEEISKFPKIMVLIYAALVPPLLEILGLPNFVVDLSGVTSTGKTTALMIAASVWGNPDTRSSHSLIGSWDSTRVYIERRAAIFNGVPVILDDTKQAKYPKDVGKIIYDIASGQSRGRGSKTGIQEMTTTRTVLITSGEAPAISFTQDGGTRARTITLWGQPFEDTSSETGLLVNKLREGIIEHHGHLGPHFASALTKHSSERNSWKRRLREIRQNYQAKLGGNPLANRLSEYWAIITLVGHLVHEWQLLPFDFTDPIKELWETLASETKEADRATAALEHVMSWATANRNKFYWQPRSNGEREYPTAPVVGWAGRWDKEHSSTPAFFPHKLKEILFQGEFEPDAILRTWNDRGWTYRDPNGRNQRQMRVDGKPSRLIELTAKAMAIWGEDEELPAFMKILPGGKTSGDSGDINYTAWN